MTKHYARLPDGTEVSATLLPRRGQPALEPGAEIRLGFDRESSVAWPLPEAASRG